MKTSASSVTQPLSQKEKPPLYTRGTALLRLKKSTDSGKFSAEGFFDGANQCRIVGRHRRSEPRYDFTLTVDEKLLEVP